ncbi:MAG: type II toxin-antitoxin system VapC family toxin [Candidatus Fermentibacteria bacterium]|nr:type II toxin-antitoxin system VapC family toxin [Candidatus Fermentibacteria bacterium]
MKYLIDTDIIIYSLKNHLEVNKNFSFFRNAPKSISVVTYGELVYGACKSQSVTANQAKIHRLAEIFPIINISSSVMETFGELKASLEQSGKIIDDMNLIIASTAITHNLVLVTNNEKHFRRIEGLEIKNWTISQELL